jgi:hypothetical protein
MRLTDCTISLTGDGVVDFSSAVAQRQNGAVNGRFGTALNSFELPHLILFKLYLHFISFKILK